MDTQSDCGRFGTSCCHVRCACQLACHICGLRAFSAEFVRRLPVQRLVFGIIGLGLTAHSLWLPVAAIEDPRAAGFACGRCGSVNAFVFKRSAWCRFIGAGYLLGAWRAGLTIRPSGRSPVTRERTG